MKTRSFLGLTLIVWVLGLLEKRNSIQQQENSHERQNTLNRPSFQRSNSTISKSKIVHANQSKVDWKIMIKYAIM